MSELEPVGEFGSAEWCEACGTAGAKMLEDANLPAGTAWGFSEVYLHPPERMLSDGRQKSAYYFMVKDGECSGGDGAPELRAGTARRKSVLHSTVSIFLLCGAPSAINRVHFRHVPCSQDWLLRSPKPMKHWMRHQAGRAPG